jgi:hypothetical protein
VTEITIDTGTHPRTIVVVIIIEVEGKHVLGQYLLMKIDIIVLDLGVVEMRESESERATDTETATETATASENVIENVIETETENVSATDTDLDVTDQALRRRRASLRVPN